MSTSTKSRVELHIHLDGSVRPATIWELSKQKALHLPGDGTLEALQEALVVKSPTTLADFLNRFQWISPAISGDLNAIERIAYELCEDKAKQHVLYLEMRASPHLLLGVPKSLTPRSVVKAILQGIKKGETDFGIKARFIICCMRSLPDAASEVVKLCDDFRAEGVVGMDVAGDEAADVDDHGEEHFHPSIVAAFREAEMRSIHRTAHACENGPPNAVTKALELLAAERIGHGYRILEDPKVYEKAKDAGIHFETCPYSSVLTGAVRPSFEKHPIATFAEDKVSFSVSTDDPTITNSTLNDEYELLRKWGLSEDDIKQSNINAILASFISDEEKRAIIKELSLAHKE